MMLDTFFNAAETIGFQQNILMDDFIHDHV